MTAPRFNVPRRAPEGDPREQPFLGEIHYFVAGGGDGPGGQSEIASWVEQSFTAQTVGGQTVYGLTAPAERAGAPASR